MQKRKFLKLLNHYRNHQIVYQLIGILSGAIITGLCIVTVMRIVDQRSLPPPPTHSINAEESTTPSESPVLTRNTGLRHIIESAYMAHGGRSALDSFVSMTRSGVIITQDGEHDVVYTYKRPDLISYTIHRDNWAIRNAFDGNKAWRQVARDGITQSREELDPQIAQVLRKNARLSEPITAPLSNLSRLTLLESQTVDETPCYVIEYADPDGSKVKFYFDQKTFLLFQRERIDDPATLANDPDTPHIIVRYHDYRKEEGAFYGFEESVYTNGKLENTFKVERLIINPGIIDSYFTPPPPL